MDKDAEIELTLNKCRAHRLAVAHNTSGRGARVRADVPASSLDGIFYFEVTIIKKCGQFGIGIGISNKVRLIARQTLK